MKTSTYLALGGLGALAWYLSRKGALGSPGAGLGGADTPSGLFPTGKEPPPEVSEVVGDALTAGEDFWLAFGARMRDVSVDHHAGGEATSAEDVAQLAQNHRDRANLFYSTVYMPASRVPITSLTVDDYKLAMAILTNVVDRTNTPLTLSQTNNQAALEQLEDINAFNKYAMYIAGAFTFGILTAIDTAAVNIAKASDEDYAKAAGGENTTAGVNDKIIRDWKEMVASGPRFATRVTDLQHQPKPAGEDAQNAAEGRYVYGATVDEPWVDGAGPSMDFGWDPTTFTDARGPVWFGVGLLRPAPNGWGAWKYGFVCKETGYQGGDVNDKRPQAERIARVARAWRALDVMRGILYPTVIWKESGVPLSASQVDADGVPFVTPGELRANLTRHVPKGLYAYRVGSFEIWGATLPPHAKDGAVQLDAQAPTKDTRFLGTPPTKDTRFLPETDAGATPPATTAPTPLVGTSAFLLRRGLT